MGKTNLIYGGKDKYENLKNSGEYAIKGILDIPIHRINLQTHYHFTLHNNGSILELQQTLRNWYMSILELQQTHFS